MAFGNSIKLSNISENWLFKLANDDSGFLYWAFSDVTSGGNFYHGVILNRPQIRESIDLARSVAKTGNISITIPDFDYQGSPISEELFGGSNHYINQTVTIHSIINADSPVQIGNYRLIDISSNGKKINLSLTSHRPWDFISIPQEKSTTNNIYFPISYGNYTPETSTDASPQYCDGAVVYPLPKDSIIGQNIKYLVHEDLATDGTDEDSRGHFYDNNLDIFIPFDPTDDTPESYGGGGSINVDNNLLREFKTYDYSENENNDFDNFNNVIPGVGGWTTDELSILNTSEDAQVHDIKYFKADIQKPDGGVSNISCEILWYADFGASQIGVGGTNRIRFIDVTNGASNILATRNIVDGDGNGSVTFTITNPNETNYIDIKVDLEITQSSILERYASCTAKLNAFKLTIKCEVDMSSEPEAGMKTIKDLKDVYCGADGLDKSWFAGNIVTEIHEAHLDMLIRYTGLEDSSGNVVDDPDNEVDNWTSLDGAKNWGIRWWTLKNIELKKILEKLQYEGGFIFRWKNDGSPQYIFIKDSINSADYTLSKYDISQIEIKPTPFSELLTKMEIDYEKHPAEDKYLTSQTCTNSTSRTDWNIQSKENIKQVKLDAYVSPAIPTTPDSNPNDDFYTYYDNVFGDIKLMVSGEIINPAFYDIEVGDIVSFDNSNIYPEKPFGYNSGSWTNLFFMVTELKRTPGKLTFTSRLVAEV